MATTVKRKHEPISATVAAQVRPSVRAELERIANAEDRKVSQIVRIAIDKFLESRQKEAVA